MAANRVKVLVVDDEKTLTDSIVLILRARGVIAMGAYDGQTGLEDARRWRPDLILLDVLLPDANGIDIALQLRHELPHSQLLLMSGQATTVDLLERAQQQGHDFEIWAKPFAPEELLQRVEQVRAA
ncbi:MAG: response regulator transcription factor [Terriglobales bacterium]